MSESQYSLVEFMRDFPDDETCLRWLWNARYNLGDDMAHCERCGEIRLFKRYAAKQPRQDWTCTACGLHVHPTAGTIFHKSSTSLHLWFYAMYLMTSTRCGISAKQLERELGVTYKTAWRMFNLIRNELMEGDEDDSQLSGQVEADEMYVGGRPRLEDQVDRRARLAHYHSKAVVFGAVERGGRVRANVVPSRYGTTLTGEVTSMVARGSVLYTDQAKQYHGISAHGYVHHTIDHSAKQYVRGHVHTQTIDGFWAQVKNATRGVHHGVSKKWLQSYVSEYAFRWNHREDQPGMFWLLLARSALRAD